MVRTSSICLPLIHSVAAKESSQTIELYPLRNNEQQRENKQLNDSCKQIVRAPNDKFFLKFDIARWFQQDCCWWKSWSLKLTFCCPAKEAILQLQQCFIFPMTTHSNLRTRNCSLHENKTFEPAGLQLIKVPRFYFHVTNNSQDPGATIDWKSVPITTTKGPWTTTRRDYGGFTSKSLETGMDNVSYVNTFKASDLKSNELLSSGKQDLRTRTQFITVQRFYFHVDYNSQDPGMVLILKFLSKVPLTYGRWGYGGSTSKSLETGINNFSRLLIHTDLKLHDIPTSGRAYQSRAHIGVILVETAHIARIVVMLHHFLMVPPQARRPPTRNTSHMLYASGESGQHDDVLIRVAKPLQLCQMHKWDVPTPTAANRSSIH